RDDGGRGGACQQGNRKQPRHQGNSVAMSFTESIQRQGSEALHQVISVPTVSLTSVSASRKRSSSEKRTGCSWMIRPLKPNTLRASDWASWSLVRRINRSPISLEYFGCYPQA